MMKKKNISAIIIFLFLISTISTSGCLETKNKNIVDENSLDDSNNQGNTQNRGNSNNNLIEELKLISSQ